MLVSAIRRPRGKAIPAIDRFIAARVERNFRYAAALAARRREHLARASRALAADAAGRTHLLARLPAVGTAIRLVLEAFLLVKALFARTEDELASAVHTVEHFINVHENRNSLDSAAVWTSKTGKPRIRPRGREQHSVPRFCDLGRAGPCFLRPPEGAARRATVASPAASWPTPFPTSSRPARSPTIST